MKESNAALVLDCLDLELFVPRYMGVEVNPLVMFPKILVISPVSYGCINEEKMFSGMLSVIDDSWQSIPVVRAIGDKVNSDIFIDSVKSIIEQVKPQKVVFFYVNDSIKSTNEWTYIRHPREILKGDISFKKEAYMQLLDLKKEL